MSSFTSELIVSPCHDGRKWKLARPFGYHVGSRNSRNVIHVPKGFLTDFASVPQFLWSWLPYWGKYGKAAIIHDYLYQTKPTTRKEADRIFLEAMIIAGTSPKRAYLMYLGVRLFGWLAWKGESRNA